MTYAFHARLSALCVHLCDRFAIVYDLRVSVFSGHACYRFLQPSCIVMSPFWRDKYLNLVSSSITAFLGSFKVSMFQTVFYCYCDSFEGTGYYFLHGFGIVSYMTNFKVN